MSSSKRDESALREVSTAPSAGTSVGGSMRFLTAAERASLKQRRAHREAWTKEAGTSMSAMERDTRDRWAAAAAQVVRKLPKETIAAASDGMPPPADHVQPSDLHGKERREAYQRLAREGPVPGMKLKTGDMARAAHYKNMEALAEVEAPPRPAPTGPGRQHHHGKQ